MNLDLNLNTSYSQSNKTIMAQRIAVVLQKGGVGKSMVTENLAAALAESGQRVVVIDFDPQGHLTEGVGLKEQYLEDHHTLYDKLLEDDRVQPRRSSEANSMEKFPTHELIMKAPQDKFDVIPATYKMMLAEQDLYRSRGREQKLDKLLAEIERDYDWILVDCPPSLGVLTDNALYATRQVVIPIQAEKTSVRALNLLLDQIESIERGLGVQIEILAIVPNLVQPSGLAEQTLKDLRESVPYVLDFEIGKRVVLQYAWDQGRSIFTYQPQSRQQQEVQQEVVNKFKDLATFVVNRIKGQSHE